ncbi:MAG: hypothetical protein ACYS30_20635, partial [Planctomycetota bacterium]
EGFPTELGIRKEERKQAGQKTTLGAIDVRAGQRGERELAALNKAFAAQLIEQGISPAEFFAKRKLKVGEEAIEKAIVGKEFARPEAQSIIDTRTAQQELARAQAAKARAEVTEKKTSDEILRDNLRLTGDFNEKQINKIVADIGLQKGGILLSVDEVGRMLTTLRTARANIENQASVGELMQEVSTESGVSGTKLAILQTMLGASQKPIRTAADRDRASRILQSYENIIIQQQAGRPIQQFTNITEGQPAPGQEGTVNVLDVGTGETQRVPVTQFLEQLTRSPEIKEAINRIVAAKKSAGETKLTPDEETLLQGKGLSGFIESINILLQER